MTDIATTRKAIIYRANHRGTKEADWIIGGYIKEHLAKMADGEIPALKTLIDMDDASFFEEVENPRDIYANIIEGFRSYKASL